MASAYSDPEIIQSGAHITCTHYMYILVPNQTISCPLHAQARRQLIANQQSWEELDAPYWIKTGPNDFEDGVPIFFEYLFHQLT